MPDTWENTYQGLDPNVYDATGDLDNDGLINIDEYRFRTSPTNQTQMGMGTRMVPRSRRDLIRLTQFDSELEDLSPCCLEKLT